MPKITPAFLHAVALGISLFIQTTSSPLAGAWLPLHLIACGMLLYKNTYPTQQSDLWRMALLWLVTIFAAAFIIKPVFNSAYFMWTFTALPLMVVCLREEDLRGYLKGFAIVLFIFVLGIDAQKLMGLGQDGRVAWPLLDPNNSAAVINLLFTPCVYLCINKKLLGRVLLLPVAFALYATGSKTGIAAAAISSCLLLTYYYGPKVLLASLLASTAGLTSLFYYAPAFIADGCNMINDRLTIWWAGWQILMANQVRGVGIGNFDRYMVYEGTTIYLPPAFAHNDILQVAVEMGLPAATVFCGFIYMVFRTTTPRTLVSACTFLAIMIQASMEFQFYLPVITMGTGLLLAYHQLKQTPAKAPDIYAGFMEEEYSVGSGDSGVML